MQKGNIPAMGKQAKVKKAYIIEFTAICIRVSANKAQKSWPVCLQIIREEMHNESFPQNVLSFL